VVRLAPWAYNFTEAGNWIGRVNSTYPLGYLLAEMLDRSIMFVCAEPGGWKDNDIAALACRSVGMPWGRVGSPTEPVLQATMTQPQMLTNIRCDNGAESLDDCLGTLVGSRTCTRVANVFCSNGACLRACVRAWAGVSHAGSLARGETGRCRSACICSAGAAGLLVVNGMHGTHAHLTRELGL
jgi:hypothetical protein